MDLFPFSATEFRQTGFQREVEIFCKPCKRINRLFSLGSQCEPRDAFVQEEDSVRTKGTSATGQQKKKKGTRMKNYTYIGTLVNYFEAVVLPSYA